MKGSIENTVENARKVSKELIKYAPAFREMLKAEREILSGNTPTHNGIFENGAYFNFVSAYKQYISSAEEIGLNRKDIIKYLDEKLKLGIND